MPSPNQTDEKKKVRGEKKKKADKLISEGIGRKLKKRGGGEIVKILKKKKKWLWPELEKPKLRRGKNYP